MVSALRRLLLVNPLARNRRVEERIDALALPIHADPVISIIIPAYSDLPTILSCLESISRYPSAAPAEVILVDSSSDNAGIVELCKINGLQFFGNAINLRYQGAFNIACRRARGKFLYLLNDDAKVTEGSLDTLLDVFHTRSDCGLAGSKLTGPNGRLIGAGGIVWDDASLSLYGYADRPTKNLYNYLREVDFCSSVSLLIRKDLFERIGGFDENYRHIQYADVNLAFHVRSEGHKVYYQPKSVVIQTRAKSEVSDISTETFGEQPVDKCRFLDRWRPVLQQSHFPRDRRIYLARDRSRYKQSVVVIDQHVPRPDYDAGSRAIAHVIKLLVENDLNVKFWPKNMRHDAIYEAPLQQLGVEVIEGSKIFGSFRAWLSRNGQFVDYILLSRPRDAISYIETVRQYSRAKLLYYGHDVHHLRLRDQLELEPSNKKLRSDAISTEALEKRIWRLVDVIYYPSKTETDYVRQYLNANNINTIARTVPLFAFDSFTDNAAKNISSRRDLLFVAGFRHRPNVDGACWFVKYVLPLVWERFPNVSLSIVGSNPTSEVLALAGPRVKVAGHVSDEELALRYGQARVAIAPLRFGAGVKGKVIEAMCHGLPIVTTSVGAQGLTEAHQAIFICDEPSAFAATVISLLDDDSLWRRISSAELAYARATFSFPALQRTLAEDIAFRKASHSPHSAAQSLFVGA